MPDRDKNQGLRFAGLGIEFAAAVAGLTLVGYWVDHHFGSSPWGVLIGAAIGIIGGMRNMIREALSANRSMSSGVSSKGAAEKKEGPADEKSQGPGRKGLHGGDS
ncbi:MAG: AtpZ/AtpI family protein [Acidobacteriota bacterium]|nr:AtpZ/AtpI family protein [Acidobacteriota bacterium]